MRGHLRHSIALIAAAFALTACGPFRHGASQPDAIVVFHNQSPDQADVFALGSGGDPIRIGTVFAGKTESLRVPETVTGGSNRVNVIARVFPTGRIVSSGPFSVEPGGSMDVTLTSDEKMMSVLPSRGA